MGNAEGIPTIYWYGSQNNNYYMAMSLLSYSLKDVLRSKGSLGLNIILKIGVEMVKRIKYIHNKGILHRDIKPDNFMFGKDSNDDLYLIDFGLSRSYICDDKHVDMRERCSPIGSINYMSINVHKGYTPSRRDDLESIVYILYYLWKGELPWFFHTNQVINKLTDHNIIANDKEIKMTNNEVPVVLKSFFIYCKSLHYSEDPKYDYLIKDVLIIKS